MSDWVLTGRKRFRSERRWGKEKIILQVEVRGIHTYWVGGMIDSEWRNVWRDARTTDLTIEVPPA